MSEPTGLPEKAPSHLDRILGDHGGRGVHPTLLGIIAAATDAGVQGEALDRLKAEAARLLAAGGKTPANARGEE